MVIWAAMSSMGRLLCGGGARKFFNMGGATAAVGGRFHPNIFGRLSIISSGESLIPSAGNSSTLPLLMALPEMLTEFNLSGKATNYYNFMSIEKQETEDYGIHKKLIMVEKSNKLPWEKLLLPNDAVCRGSSHGWLAFIHPDTRQIGLFNPFGDKVSFNPCYIPLPCSETHSCKKCNKTFIRILKKMALSCAPSLVGGYDCDVVGITESYKHKGLVYCNLRDSSWTNLKGSFQEYSDVIYFTKHGLFYAVPNKYFLEPFHIESWDFTTDPCSPKNTLIQPSHDFVAATAQFPRNPQGWRAKNPDEKDPYGMHRRYLVEASGELLLVLRNLATQVDKDGFRLCHNDECGEDDELRTHITVGFAVYKMDWSENKWEPVESLGDKALFLGINHSFSVSTHDLPQVMANSIYFSDDMDTWFDSWGYESGYDTGVYNMEDGFIFGVLPSYLEEIEQLPVWVLPNPN